MRFSTLQCMLLTGAVLAASSAAAGTMDLTRDGTLYQLVAADQGLALTWTTPDGASQETLIPQSANADIATASVDVDEYTSTPHIVWQGGDVSPQVLLASYNQGTWLGPFVLAGDDGSEAINPQLLVHRETAVTIPEDEASTPITVETTFVHVVWWSLAYDGDVGGARYLGIPVQDDGSPDFATLSELSVNDLLPYGIGCHGIDDADQLAFPRLFADPETGGITIFATDFVNCLFQIVQLESELEDMDLPDKRGRHSIIVGRTNVIAINTDLPLGTAKAKMGRGMSVVIYWDADAAIEYSLLDVDGWTGIRSLALNPELDHEKAVTLIQSLTR